MSNEEAAREIAILLDEWDHVLLSTAPPEEKVNEFLAALAAKLDELYGELPESLEAAVRMTLKNNVYRFRDKQTCDRWKQADELAVEVVSAVAPLLADRDNQIQVLKVEIDDWESSNHERVIADLNKRIEELEGQHQSKESPGTGAEA